MIIPTAIQVALLSRVFGLLAPDELQSIGGADLLGGV